MSARDEAKRLLALAERDLRSMGAVIEQPEFAEEVEPFDRQAHRDRLAVFLQAVRQELRL